MESIASVRPPAVAGLFYPDDPDTLEREVRGFLRDARASLAGPVPTPGALVAPHAGYVYSGEVAARAYATLLPEQGGEPGGDGRLDSIQRVVLLGPSHRVPFRGVALSGAHAFETPLGRVPVSHELDARLADLPWVGFLDAAHAQEHSLEVHLPFLQLLLPGRPVIPIVVGEATPDQVATVLERLWSDPGTLVVVSTDLSHYLDYDTARRIDEATARRIEALRDDIRPEEACGARPLNGLLRCARGRGMHVHRLDLRSSGDTAGPRDRVVGYGSFLLH